MKKNKARGNNEQVYDFDVALSFAGEDRKYVEKVANRLDQMGYRPFYDSNETVTLWGKDLYEHLSEVYRVKSKFTVMFISKHYSKKLWTNHERKSAQARAFSENSEYILPARFDKSKIPGILETTGYIDLSHTTPNQFAEMIKQKLGPVVKFDYFPPDVSRLVEFMKIKTEKQKKRVFDSARSIFAKFKLMTPKERYILAMAAIHGCGEGPPDDVHIELPYLARQLKMSSDEIIEAISRVSSLSFEFEVHKPKKDKIKRSVHHINHSVDSLHIKFFFNHGNHYYNASDVYSAIFNCLAEFVCIDCVSNNLVSNDFSILSHISGFPDK